jgi:anti-sigma regulatory factor (Ser/Thr protein kinase)
MVTSVGESTDHGPVGLDLPFRPESAGVARHELVRWMRQLHTPSETCDDARLLISELVGNAVRHARPLADGTMRVTWATCDQGVAIAVTDGGSLTAPTRVDAAVSDLAGRGLAIVETLAVDWWVESTRSRTTVHALLPVS